jgi:hypothetical protein
MINDQKSKINRYTTELEELIELEKDIIEANKAKLVRRNKKK